MAKKTKNISFTVAYLWALLLIGFRLAPLYSTATSNSLKPQEVWLNVFVHGIMSIKPHISWSNFMLFMKDKVEGTLYEKTVELMREDPFFYKNQAMQRLGFRQVSPELIEGNSSASLAFILDEVGKHYGINSNNRYYTFGWSGLLSPKSRYRDAKRLFKELVREVKRLQTQNITPRIRIIGYSHGGNVGLNLALVRQKEFTKANLSIDELLLLGAPIIADTDYLINDPMFKQVFNLYSLRDRIQPMDLFAPNQIFSDRIFRPRKGFVPPDKLIQVQLKVTRCKGRVRKCPRKFNLSHDFTRPNIVYGKSGLLRDISPGHVELWFFGWTPINYRTTYPLHPLPTISFAPIITNHAKKIALTPEHSIVADIRPQHNVILFRQNNNHQVHSTVPYICKQKLTRLQNAIYQCKPELYSDDIYNAHIQDAVRNAQQIMEANRSEQRPSNKN